MVSAPAPPYHTQLQLQYSPPRAVIQTGPGTKAADWRKNCKLTLNLEFDEGFQ